MAQVNGLKLVSGQIREISPTADDMRLASLGLGAAAPGSGGLTMTGTLTNSGLGAGVALVSTSGVFSSSAGTAGQILTSNGAGVAPSFQAPPAASVDIGSSIPSGTVGRVLFVGAGPALAEDAALFWDNTNKWLGIGTAAPASALHIYGSGQVIPVIETTGTGSTDQASLSAYNTAGVKGYFGVTSTGWTPGQLGMDASYAFVHGVSGVTVNTNAGELRLSHSSVIVLNAVDSATLVVPSGIDLGVGGTPTAGAKLHIVGTGTVLPRVEVTSTGTTDQASLTVYNSAGVQGYFGVASTGWTAGLGIDASYAFVYGVSGVTINAAAGELRLCQGSTSRIVIDGTGIGLFGATPVAQLTSGADLTNNVTSGGMNDQIDDFTDLTIYANDAAAIRDAIYQLARKVKQLNDGLRSRGDFT